MSGNSRCHMAVQALHQVAALHAAPYAREGDLWVDSAVAAGM